MSHEVISAQSDLGDIRLFTQPMIVKIGDIRHHVDTRKYVSLKAIGEMTRSSPPDTFKLYERVEGLPWMRERLEQDRTSANFQGNPLWPMAVLAKIPQLARFFGLAESGDDKRCCIPSCHTINARLTALKSAGFETAWSFAHYADNQPFSDRDYVEAIVRDRTLPCAAENTRDFLHDWSYHFISLLLPKFLEGVRLNVEVLLTLAKKVKIPTLDSWNIYGHSEDEYGRIKSRTFDEVLDYDRAIARRMAVEIDVITARPVQALTEILAGRIEEAERIARPCGLFLSAPTLASLRHILPEVAQVIDDRHSGLADHPAAGHSFIDYAHEALASLNQGLEQHEKQMRAWEISPDAMGALLKQIDSLRNAAH